MFPSFLTHAAAVAAASAISLAIVATLAEVGHPHPDGYWLARVSPPAQAPQDGPAPVAAPVPGSEMLTAEATPPTP